MYKKRPQKKTPKKNLYSLRQQQKAATSGPSGSGAGNSTPAESGGKNQHQPKVN